MNVQLVKIFEKRFYLFSIYFIIYKASIQKSSLKKSVIHDRFYHFILRIIKYKLQQIKKRKLNFM
jgi:hypothetical protein